MGDVPGAGDGPSDGVGVPVQGHLTHKNQRPPRTPPYDYAARVPGVGWYQDTSPIRKRHPPQDHHRAIVIGLL